MSMVTLEYVNRNISHALKRTSYDNFALQNKLANPCFCMTYKDICPEEHGKNMDLMSISFNRLKKTRANDTAKAQNKSADCNYNMKKKQHLVRE